MASWKEKQLKRARAYERELEEEKEEKKRPSYVQKQIKRAKARERKIKERKEAPTPAPVLAPGTEEEEPIPTKEAGPSPGEFIGKVEPRKISRPTEQELMGPSPGIYFGKGIGEEPAPRGPKRPTAPSETSRRLAEEFGVGPVPRYTGFGREKARGFGTGFIGSYEAWVRGPTPDWFTIGIGGARKAIPDPFEHWAGKKIKKVPGGKWAIEHFVPSEKQAEREFRYMRKHPSYAAGSVTGEISQAIAFTEFTKWAKPRLKGLLRRGRGRAKIVTGDVQGRISKLGEAGAAPKQRMANIGKARELLEQFYKKKITKSEFLKRLGRTGVSPEELGLQWKVSARGPSEAGELALRRFAQKTAKPKPKVISPGALKARPMVQKQKQKQKPVIREMGPEEKAAWAEAEQDWNRALQKSTSKLETRALELKQRQKLKLKTKQKVGPRQKIAPKLAPKQAPKQKEKQALLPKPSLKVAQKEKLAPRQREKLAPRQRLFQAPKVTPVSTPKLKIPEPQKLLSVQSLHLKTPQIQKQETMKLPPPKFPKKEWKPRGPRRGPEWLAWWSYKKKWPLGPIFPTVAGGRQE